MANFRVIFNIDVEVSNPLDAAKKAENLIKEKGEHFQYYVQNEKTSEVFSIDLTDSDEDAVLSIEIDDEPIKKAFNCLW